MPRPSLTRPAALALLAVLVLAAAGAPATAEPRQFRIQPEASEVTFKATSRFMNADGRFGLLSGSVVVDPADWAGASITLSIQAGSIDTGIGLRDNHLRSEDFFDVQRFPVILFESVRVEREGKRATVIGRLTMHGVTREVAVPVEVTLSEAALVASGEFTLKRTDYGITYQSFLNPIANEVRIAFTFRARAS